MKKQVIAWEKVFAQHIFDKGLVSRIYKKFSKLTSKETDTLNKKVQRFEQTFLQRRDRDSK